MKLNISSGNAKWIFEYQNMWMNIKAQLFEKLSEVFARDRKNSECKLDAWQDEIKTTFHDKLVSCDMYGQKIDSLYIQDQNRYLQVFCQNVNINWENQKCFIEVLYL